MGVQHQGRRHLIPEVTFKGRCIPRRKRGQGGGRHSHPSTSVHRKHTQFALNYTGADQRVQGHGDHPYLSSTRAPGLGDGVGVGIQRNEARRRGLGTGRRQAGEARRTGACKAAHSLSYTCGCLSAQRLMLEHQLTTNLQIT